mgnify:CR=1 FL=1
MWPYTLNFNRYKDVCKLFQGEESFKDKFLEKSK